ncbi:MAG: histidinol-phosphatase, partial [Treponema sp.]|nr:histidinol-phosphatase [Treponema sp.]
MPYLYETHLHTALSSACGVSLGSEYISRYIDLGYSGIIVTDHFYRGNTAICYRLTWRDWVNKFCRGYEETKEEGDRLGLDVFFGWEETFDGADDYLIYGLDKAWLLEH